MSVWYLTRGTGAAALLLLTLSLALGVINVKRLSSRRVPRFLLDDGHRTISLLVVVLLVVHIATTLLDGYAPVAVVDVVVPFGGAYRPIWLGLGAVALDLLLALVLTSLLRARLGLRAWRAVHWLAYACWPVAVVHGLGTGSDVKAGWLLWLSLGCVVVVVLAVLLRVATSGPGYLGARGGALATLLAGLLALAIWLPAGPLGENWAKRSGTPSSIIGGKHPAATGSQTKAQP